MGTTSVLVLKSGFSGSAPFQGETSGTALKKTAVTAEHFLDVVARANKLAGVVA